MFRRDGGNEETDLLTENANPSAWPLVGYGSCPRITTFVEEIELLKDLKTLSRGGEISVPFSSVSIR